MSSGQLTAENTGAVIPIKLELERSEYRGQFNFPNFDASVRALLQKFETEVRKDKELKDLRTLTNEANGGILFLEGYLFDKDEGKTAFAEAARQMRSAGGQSGITLSDPFCADRHRTDFLRLIRDEMDFVIGNAAEWTTLYETDDLAAALAQAADVCATVVCTRSGDPVWLLQGGEKTEVPVEKVTPVDATGAGDQFAAGFLYGFATGTDMDRAGRMGVAAAAEVIGHVGPRPVADLRALFASHGLL